MTRTVVPSPIVHALLDKNNYEEWSLLVKTYLLAKDLWDVVEATTEPPRQEDGEVEFKAWRKSNAKALHSIQISCGADTLSSIMGASTAKVAWDILAEKLKPAESSQATGNGDEERYANPFIPGFVKSGDWESVMQLLKLYPKAVSARHETGVTILHWAVYGKEVDIAKELVDLMSPKDLEIQDDIGLTALHYVIKSTPESVELAKRMVEKNKKLLSIVLPPSKTSPLARKITPRIQAHREGAEEMAQYLCFASPPETLNDSECAMLIINSYV
ncbi:uncharacterized protein [Malus domestica]|uniref:uncharacterized protein isoform X2 n=1 Tax=Malus domestica TaxID=3750 RepID=UPI0039758DF2